MKSGSTVTARVGLPQQRAFVLQLADDAAPGAGTLKGRAIHIDSGEAAPFGSVNELLRFLEAQLARVERTDDATDR